MTSAPPRRSAGRTPKKPRPARTPMNSVTSVRKFPKTKSPMAKRPQNLPKRSKISSAWPRWVTAPKRTVISCTTNPITKVRTTKGRKKPTPKRAPVGGVGKHARRIIFAQEDENSRADQKPQQPEASERLGPALPSGARHFPAVASAIDVLVGEKADRVPERRRDADGRFGGGMGRLAA